MHAISGLIADFLWLIDVNAGGLGLKKGQGILHLNNMAPICIARLWITGVSGWHYRQRKIILELIMHFKADTDTDKNYFGINFS